MAALGVHRRHDRGLYALSLPVIGGNVSFYNESGGADIDPTPVLGVLGLVETLHARPPGLAWSADDTLVLVGPRTSAGGDFPLEGTRWATERRQHRTGRVPAVDFAAHAAVCAFVASLVAAHVAGADGASLVHAVHDVSGGGLAVALAEMAAAAGTGCAVVAFDDAAELFTELASRFVVATCAPDDLCAGAAGMGVASDSGAGPGRWRAFRRPWGRCSSLPVAALSGGATRGNLALALGEL